jgi:hypothetical protein
VEMQGSRSEFYGDHAFLLTQAPHGWQWPKKLRYRAYDHEFEAQLSLAPSSPEHVGFRSGEPRDGKRGASNNAPHADWQEARRRKQRVVKAEPCRDFKRGTCTRGESCIFNHAREDCRDAARGRCTRKRCKFEHPDTEPDASAALILPRAPQAGPQVAPSPVTGSPSNGDDHKAPLEASGPAPNPDASGGGALGNSAKDALGSHNRGVPPQSSPGLNPAHAAGTDPHVTGGAAAATDQRPVCRDFLHGKCKRGSNCLDAHTQLRGRARRDALRDLSDHAEEDDEEEDIGKTSVRGQWTQMPKVGRGESSPRGDQSAGNSPSSKRHKKQPLEPLSPASSAAATSLAAPPEGADSQAL